MIVNILKIYLLKNPQGRNQNLNAFLKMTCHTLRTSTSNSKDELGGTLGGAPCIRNNKNTQVRSRVFHYFD